MALLTPVVALIAALLLGSFTRPHVWFLFYPAVFVSSWVGGRRLGIIATALASVLAWWFLVRPERTLMLPPGQLFSLGVFSATGIGFAFFHERLTRAVAAVAAQEQLAADLGAMTKLHEIGSLFLTDREYLEPVFTKILDAAIAVSRSDFGSIQLLDPVTSDLRLIAQRGFSKEWTTFWNDVTAGQGTCGTALQRGERVVIEDVEASPIFVGTAALEVQRKAGVRAVQSTPIFTRAGKPVGMFSTHHKRPYRPDGRELRLLDLLARQAGDIVDVWTTKQRVEEALATSERANDRLEQVAGELRRTNEDLGDAREFLENVLESSTEYSIIAQDLDRWILAWNAGATRDYGYEAAEVIGKSADLLYTPADVQSGIVAALHLRALQEGHATALFRRRRKNGSEFLARVMITRRNDARGKAIGYLLVSHDVTAEQRLIEEQRFLAEVGEDLQGSLDYATTVEHVARSVIAFVGDWCAIDVVDENGNFRRIKTAHAAPEKAAFFEDFGCPVPERDGAHPLQKVLETKQPLLVPEVSREFLRSIAEDDAHLRLLESLGCRSFMLVPLVARGRLMAVLSIAACRQNRRFVEADLRLSRELARRAALALENARLYAFAQHAIEAREQVLGIVAHDLRNPLGTILMQARAIERRDDQAERRARMPGEAIERAVTRMSRLIQDLLDVGRLEAGQLAIEPARVPAGQVVSESLDAQKALAASAGLELTFAEHLPLGDVDVWADRDRLLQLFENLLGNAIKFTSPGGRVTAGARERETDVLFWIADTGPGIAEEDVPHLFERFWQAKKVGRQGAGLGLPIVKGIVEAHGGRIWVESTLGRGTTFFFTIPTAPRAEARPEAP